MKLILKSAWESVTSKVVRMLTRSLGPVTLDFELPMEKKVANEPTYELPDPPYSHLSKQERFAIFEKWMIEYNKEYKNEAEKIHRYEVFTDSMMFIERICAKIPKPCALGLNATSDLTAEEYVEKTGIGGSLHVHDVLD